MIPVRQSGMLLLKTSEILSVSREENFPEPWTVSVTART